ncbi:MAG: DNA mismatch repair protein MutS [Gemmatimonadetes bacterium]|nr:DNA mismatch repair protein MutS [Gemmatimonadota bacterium]
MSAQTPLMQQYHEIKARHKNAILLFRMGDFFETFYDDAETISRALDITLTSRNNGGAAEVPLAGVPAKAAPEYIRRLVQQGFRVAVCEQVEDPKLAKGIVKRAVIETVTPGAAFADDLLDVSRSTYVAALRTQAGLLGIAAADISTGEFRLISAPMSEVAAALARIGPREVVVAPEDGEAVRIARQAEALITERSAWEFEPASSRRDLAEHFGVLGVEGLGIGERDDAIAGAGGALVRYLKELQPAGVGHLARPLIERAGDVMPLDEMTRRNLELVESLRGGGAEGTLLSVLDRTETPMGARLLRSWLVAPLVAKDRIESRLQAVAALHESATARAALASALDDVRDIERLGAKTAAHRASPRELRALGDSLKRLPALRAALEVIAPRGELTRIARDWDDAADCAARIEKTLVERPAVTVGEGPVIAPGVHAELDELHAIATGGKDSIAGLQHAERERTGIASLKVGHNRVFGYYIEITNANSHLVPADYQRRQTLTGAERYVTPALKEFEEKVLHATERIETIERETFEALRRDVGGEIRRLQQIAANVAHLDVLASFADVASREGYVCPEIHEGAELEIVAGRHPVVERMMPREQFIPNDVQLTPDARMIILTGPNMAGKSTILRQIGLQVLMAQVGCFVPAKRARIGIADRIFTRVGASDNLVRGQSTFMVEMSETAAILNTATARSLVLLDEIGRGTSTWDGVSIAWAVSEHLHARVGCKTVFATHYHELTQLADEHPAVRNFNVAVAEHSGTIRFLHALRPGGADRSYGIEVGRLAGLPPAVLKRARALLTVLEREQLAVVPGRVKSPPEPVADQLGLFGEDLSGIAERLRGIDPNATTPLEALAVLSELVADARAAQSRAGASGSSSGEAR